MAADEGGGKPVGDAAAPVGDAAVPDAHETDGADDLDALAGGLGSIAPAADDAEGDDEAPDLAALGALAARTTLADAEPEAEPLRLTGPGNVPKPAAAANTAALGDRGADAPTSSAAALRAAASATVLATPPPAAPARAPWVMPLLVGIGVGVAIAGGVFGFSQRAAPAAAADSASAAPTALLPGVPERAALGPTAPTAATSPVVPSAAPADPTAEPAGNAATRAAANLAHPHALPAVRSGSANPPPGAERADAPVLAVHPATEVAQETEPGVAAAAAETAVKPVVKSAPTMDALLDEALSPKARRDELAARQQAALEAEAPPATPSRAEVTQAMTVLLPAIRGCAMGQSGLATAGIVVNSDGRVASVDVAGAPFAGTASGRCMEGVLRRARFPRFTQPSFRIKFPLAIQ